MRLQYTSTSLFCFVYSLYFSYKNERNNQFQYIETDDNIVEATVTRSVVDDNKKLPFVYTRDETF